MMPTKLRRKGRPRQRWEDFRESGRRIKNKRKREKGENIAT